MSCFLPCSPTTLPKIPLHLISKHGGNEGCPCRKYVCLSLITRSIRITWAPARACTHARTHSQKKKPQTKLSQKAHENNFFLFYPNSSLSYTVILNASREKIRLIIPSSFLKALQAALTAFLTQWNSHREVFVGRVVDTRSAWAEKQTNIETPSFGQYFWKKQKLAAE